MDLNSAMNFVGSGSVGLEMENERGVEIVPKVSVSAGSWQYIHRILWFMAEVLFMVFCTLIVTLVIFPAFSCGFPVVALHKSSEFMQSIATSDVEDVMGPVPGLPIPNLAIPGAASQGAPPSIDVYESGSGSGSGSGRAEGASGPSADATRRDQHRVRVAEGPSPVYVVHGATLPPPPEPIKVEREADLVAYLDTEIAAPQHTTDTTKLLVSPAVLRAYFKRATEGMVKTPVTMAQLWDLPVRSVDGAPTQTVWERLGLSLQIGGAVIICFSCACVTAFIIGCGGTAVLIGDYLKQWNSPEARTKRFLASKHPKTWFTPTRRVAPHSWIFTNANGLVHGDWVVGAYNTVAHMRAACVLDDGSVGLLHYTLNWGVRNTDSSETKKRLKSQKKLVGDVYTITTFADYIQAEAEFNAVAAVVAQAKTAEQAETTVFQAGKLDDTYGFRMDDIRWYPVKKNE